MAKVFKKGDKVFYISTWSDRDGVLQFFAQPALVQSCGAKQMVLSDRSGETFRGAHFRPQVQQWNGGEVILDDGAADAQERALAHADVLAEARRQVKIEQTKEQIRLYSERYSATDRYVMGRKADLAAYEANAVAPAILRA